MSSSPTPTYLGKRSSTRVTVSPQVRIAREAQAFDDGRVMANNLRWQARVPHVMNGPNSTHGNRRFRRFLSERAVGASVMEIGCGDGELSAELHAMGARTVYGVDVSARQVEEASARYGGLEGVAFDVRGAETPIAGHFNLIVGHAILHHLDFRTILVRLFDENLLPGGRMVFLEPMSHPLTLAFHQLARSAHTPDEWPITPADVAWLRQRFGARVVPINLLSFPVGVFSSLVLTRDDNWLMRFADRVDRRLERRRRLLARGRDGLIVIDRAEG